MRHAAKQICEAVLVRAIGDPQRMAGRSLILAYHNVVPAGLPLAGDLSLHLSIDAFATQLDLLEEHCDVRPLDAVLEGGHFSSRPTVALTFDDAYRGAVELALPEVARRGLPATLFVAPGLLGAASFWWDELAPVGRGLPDSLRRRALDEWRGDGHTIRKALEGDRNRPAMPPWFSCVTQAEIDALRSMRGLTLGAHSWDHLNLSRLSGQELDVQLGRPLDWLRHSGAPRVNAIAYPYGLRSTEVEARAASAGYTAGLLVSGGWWTPLHMDRWRIPRLNVPAGLSKHGFLLRLCGFRASKERASE